MRRECTDRRSCLFCNGRVRGGLERKDCNKVQFIFEGRRAVWDAIEALDNFLS